MNEATGQWPQLVEYEILQAFDTLIKWYLFYPEVDLSMSCPLCKVIDQYYDGSCKKCPWVVFTGKTCVIATTESVNDGRRHRTPEWCEASLKRIREWKEKMLEANE